MANRKVSTAGFLHISGKFYTNAPEIDDLVETIYPIIKKDYNEYVDRETLLVLLEKTIKNYEKLPTIKQISKEIIQKLEK